MNKKLISRIFTSVFFLIFFWYAFNNPSLIEGLKSVSVYMLIVVAIAKILTHINNGLFTKWTAEQFVPKIKTTETIYISVISAIGNFLGPLLGGTTIRAVYMKKIYNLPYSKFTATLAGYYLILFLANSLLATISLLLLTSTGQTNFLILLFSGLFCFLLALSFVKLPKRERFEKYSSKAVKWLVSVVYEIESGWKVLRRNKKLIAKLSLLGLIAFFITYITAYVEFKAVGANISFSGLGLYTSLIVLSMLISVTPGALGIREAIILVVGTTLGVSSEQILQVAVIDRGVNFIVLFALFLVTRSSFIRKRFSSNDLI